jgi:hypothetical protein
VPDDWAAAMLVASLGDEKLRVVCSSLDIFSDLPSFARRPRPVQRGGGVAGAQRGGFLLLHFVNGAAFFSTRRAIT